MNGQLSALVTSENEFAGYEIDRDVALVESNFEMLLPIERLENGMRAVDARKLHEVLGSLQHFTDWMKNRIKKYNFKETFDFIRQHKIMNQENNTNLLRTKTEYFLSVEMAKELAMIENNDMGSKVRRYFIEIEKKATEIEKLGEGTTIDLEETVHQIVNRIVETLGERYISKEAHERILELEKKLLRMEYEMKLMGAAPIAEPVRQKSESKAEPKVEPKAETIPAEKAQGTAEASSEGMTVSKAVKRLVSETGAVKADILRDLGAAEYISPSPNGTYRWNYTWAFNNGFGSYDGNNNFKLNEDGYNVIRKHWDSAS